MKIYAFIAVASTCFLITSCTTDGETLPRVATPSEANQHNYTTKTTDSIFLEPDPTKSKGKG
ncbi:MAG: hypothetical protein ACOVMH_08840 [Flavobacterium sp.]